MMQHAWVSCPNCYMQYAIPAALDAKAQAERAGVTIYCPAGHGWHYMGDRPVDVERRARQRAEQENARLAEVARAAAARADQATASLTRLKRRAARGVCPCCNRSFVALANHIATKHPEFRKAA